MTKTTTTIYTTAAAVLLLGVAMNSQADWKAPVGVAAPDAWLAPGQTATIASEHYARLPDGTRYRVEIWNVQEDDGTPAEDIYGGGELSGAYTATDDGSGSWACGNITLEGQCLPTVAGDVSHVTIIGAADYHATLCEQRGAGNDCLVYGVSVPLDDLSAHNQPPPAPGVTSVAYDAPNLWTYYTGEIRFSVPNSEQDQITSIKATLYHPDTGALEHTIVGANPCSSANNSNLCAWQTGWCAPRSDGGGVYDYELSVTTVGGVTSAAGREKMYLNCP